MDNQAALPPGFISIDDAIELINSDKRTVNDRDNPVVDTSFMVSGLPYLREDNGNFTIRKITMGTVKGKKAYVSNGNVFVTVTNKWDRDRLEHAILEKHKQVTGREVNPEAIGVRSLTTAFDDEDDSKRKVRANKKPMTRLGEDTSGGYQTINGDGK